MVYGNCLFYRKALGIAEVQVLAAIAIDEVLTVKRKPPAFAGNPVLAGLFEAFDVIAKDTAGFPG